MADKPLCFVEGCNKEGTIRRIHERLGKSIDLCPEHALVKIDWLDALTDEEFETIFDSMVYFNA